VSDLSAFTIFILILYSVDVIVALDACFTQKRKKSPRDPQHHHEDTVFIAEADVKAMEDRVNTLRPPDAKGKGEKKNADDGYEGNLKVPASVLDGCNESFTAADEKRQKASTKSFSDTGVMALLCRHDRVIWLVNMTSAGEKQHYAFALIERLFNQIPPTMRVGLLYDIACQIHRSCILWGFLGEFLSRIVFGISVFHAYGHQWACQVIYHPRKCPGFGLTDGEGCERFWSSIKILIPTLRVSGVSV
jgi:hypothetical protein